MSARSEFSRKTRASVFLRANGLCEGCGAKLKVGEGEIDHILPCAFGGGPSSDNAKLLCRVCHRQKTAADIKAIRKADRQRDKHTGAIAKPSSFQSRGFDKRPPQRRASAPLAKPLPARRMTP